MMASAHERIPCEKCKTAGAIATCDGCEKSFCANDFVKHRQELSLEMDNLGQEYDLLRRDLIEDTKEHPLLTRINVWEQISIDKIRKKADTERNNLQKLVDQIKTNVESSIIKLIEEIRTSRQEDDFTEKEFQKWNEQLNQLRRTFNSSFNITIENDYQDETVIKLIEISNQQEKSVPSPFTSIRENHFRLIGKPHIVFDEKFDQKTDAVLSENNFIATCVSKYGTTGTIIYGCNSYSTGIHDISFRIEKKGLSRLFFGIYSSLKKRVNTISSSNENSIYGWWDLDSAVLNGTKQDSGNEHIISTGDKIVLTLDCVQQQIQLYHIRENRQVHLSIDINKCPFPWKIIVKLTANGDCVRIL